MSYSTVCSPMRLGGSLVSAKFCFPFFVPFGLQSSAEQKKIKTWMGAGGMPLGDLFGPVRRAERVRLDLGWVSAGATFRCAMVVLTLGGWWLVVWSHFHRLSGAGGSRKAVWHVCMRTDELICACSKGRISWRRWVLLLSGGSNS